MTIKKRNYTSQNKSIENLADELADKPYGKNNSLDNKIIRTTITLPAYMLHKLEDIALKNKRETKELKSVSAIIRSSITKYFISNT